MTQLQFQGVEPRRMVGVTPQRMEPAVWIRRLRVVRELSAGPEYVIREVELRCGLNIVWAPPQASHAGGLFGSGMTGHTAGKTSFCRLIRYALGDRHFANEAVRRRVRAMLPSAWLLAEVVVDGRLWAVARPLGIGAHPFCIPDAEIDQLTATEERTEFRLYLDAVAATTTDRLPARRFPGSEQLINWDHLLPWLTRDQECRFADFDVWRHPSSASDAPALTADERQFLIRSVLGLISDAEREEQHQNAILVARKRERAEQVPLLRHQVSVDERRLSHLLGETDTIIGPGLLAEGIRDELTRRRAALRDRRAELASTDKRTSARMALEHAVAEEANAKRDLMEAENRLAVERGALAQIDNHLQGKQQQELLDALPPARGYCSVPMSMAHESGCPLASTRPIDFQRARGERSLDEERITCVRIIAALEREQKMKATHLKAASARLAQARSDALRLQTSVDRELNRLGEEESHLREADRLLERAVRSREEADQAEAEVKLLGNEIDQSYARQELLRKRQLEAYGRLSAAFEYIVRALLGEEMQASIGSAGRSLELHVARGGDRDSAAITTVKLLAFDLAALLTSVEGHGQFPRLLMHDGPREADLAPDVYERLFLCVREFETSFAAAPGFQYIVTTTTEPPAAVAGAPWLRLLLSGAQPEHRRYRMDF